MQFQSTLSGNTQASLSTVAQGVWNTATSPTLSLTLTQQTQAFKVFLSGIFAAVQNIQASISNNTNEDVVVVDLQMTPTYPQLGSNVGFVEIPMGIGGNVGDSITFNLTKNAGGGGNMNINYSVIALGQSSIVRTTPGLPISAVPMGGLLGVSVNSVVGNVVILPAPPTGMAYRIHCAVAFNAAGKSWLVGGGLTYAAMSQAGTGNEGYCACHGNLCTTALSINSGTAGIGVTVQYDLVSVPTFIG